MSPFFHPVLVHLPIALAVLMPLVAGGLLLAWWRRWLPRGSWTIAVLLQLALVGSGLAAIRSGKAEGERVEKVVPEQLVEAHEEAAETFEWAGAGVLALMLVGLGLRARPVGLTLAAASTVGTIAVLALGYQTGHAGGSLVYEHNAAQVYQRGAAAPQPARPGEAGERGEDLD